MKKARKIKYFAGLFCGIAFLKLHQIEVIIVKVPQSFRYRDLSLVVRKLFKKLHYLAYSRYYPFFASAPGRYISKWDGRCWKVPVLLF